MLLIIGAIGLMFTIGQFRKPGIPFFSVVTIFNRKEKLTETGSKVYIVFFSIAAIGIVLNLVLKH
jgi:hypothetical protein